MTVALDMEDVTTLFDAFILIAEDRLVHFPMRDILNPFCWASLIPAPKLDKYGMREEGESSSLTLSDIELVVKKLNVSLDCLNCTSPGMQGLVDTMSSPGASEDLTLLGNSLLGFGAKMFTEKMVQDVIDRALNDAGRMCPHDPRYVPDAAGPFQYKSLTYDRTTPASSLIVLLLVVAMACLFAVILIGTLVKLIVRHRHKKWLKTLPATKIHILQNLQDADEQLENELNENTKAMLWADEIPAKVRYLVPVVIMVNIVFFVTGHLRIAATSSVSISLAGEEVPIDNFFSFSIKTAVIDMWEAGAKEMAIFLLIFALIWPYVKQVITLFCWVAPTKMISVTTRGKTYDLLDILAKWSMVDIFVMFISMVAFRYVEQPAVVLCLLRILTFPFLTLCMFQCTCCDTRLQTSASRFLHA